MAEFMLMFLNGPAEAPPPAPEAEMQAVIARYIAWGERIRSAGHGSPRGGARLSDVYSDPGRLLSRVDGEFLAADGPLAETKEVVGGYGVIEAANYAEAVELCRDHPALDHGRIMIRQLA
jgi:hypothetical protein